MKKKTKSTKKPVTKKKKEKNVVVVLNVRQVSPKPLFEGNKHVVRLVTNCNPSLLTFNSTAELNEWLFEFDFQNHDKDPGRTGTWIDHIFLDVQGGIFDMDNLEQE